MQLDWHDLKTNGCPALLRALKQIETTLTQQEEDIAELQYLVSEEIIERLAPHKRYLLPRQRQIVAELGGGWRIERQPAEPNADAATSAPPPPNPAATVTSRGTDWVRDTTPGGWFKSYRQPNEPGTPGVSWLPDDWVTQLSAEIDGE